LLTFDARNAFAISRAALVLPLPLPPAIETIEYSCFAIPRSKFFLYAFKLPAALSIAC